MATPATQFSSNGRFSQLKSLSGSQTAGLRGWYKGPNQGQTLKVEGNRRSDLDMYSNFSKKTTLSFNSLTYQTKQRLDQEKQGVIKKLTQNEFIPQETIE